MSALALSDAVVSRRRARLLGPISLHVDGPGPTIVLGPNGSGKTTFLRVLHGLERLSSGRRTAPPPNVQAFVFQHPIMLRRSVAQNLAYPLELAKRPRAEIAAKTQSWADRIGLGHAMERPAPRLSGGEKQKLALARALITAPEILFLDEPCASLDGRATQEIEAILVEAAAAGTHIIMATHDLGQARRLARHVIFLLNGKHHESGPADRLMNAPQTPEFKAFLQGDIVT